jgi:hypothetical protein
LNTAVGGRQSGGVKKAPNTLKKIARTNVKLHGMSRTGFVEIIGGFRYAIT